MTAARLRGLLLGWIKAMFRSPLEREREFYRRYRDLSAAIDQAPAGMSNFVLRGELSLARGDFERATADFEAAVALAEDLDDTKGWQIAEQVMRDRALHGLQLVARRMDSIGASGPGMYVEA